MYKYKSFFQEISKSGKEYLDNAYLRQPENLEREFLRGEESEL